MKKYFNNVIVTLLIAITVSSLSACASKTAASQTAPEKQTSSVTTPQAEIPVPFIHLRDYSQKSNLKKLFEGYTEDYAYAFREARRTYGGGGLMFYTLPLRQSMSLNDGDILIRFDDEDWKAMQETKVNISVDILILVQSSKRYVNNQITARVNDQEEKSYFSIANFIETTGTEEADSYSLYLGRK